VDYESYFEYIPKFLIKEDSKKYFIDLYKNIPWVSHSYTFYGKDVPMPRLVKWYSPHPYVYSGLYNQPCEMNELVKEIMNRLNNTNLNSCLLNLYRNGNDSIARHKDDETSMDREESIYVISLGSPRKFIIKSDDKIYNKTLIVEHGSLFIMKKGFQDLFTHEISKEKNIVNPRISLTFRKSLSNI